MKILLFISGTGCLLSKKMLKTIEKLHSEFPEHQLEIFDHQGYDADGTVTLMRQFGITILPSLVIDDIFTEGFQLIKPIRHLLQAKRIK